jgi:hypothetical protein
MNQALIFLRLRCHRLVCVLDGRTSRSDFKHQLCAICNSRFASRHELWFSKLRSRNSCLRKRSSGFQDRSLFEPEPANPAESSGNVTVTIQPPASTCMVPSTKGSHSLLFLQYTCSVISMATSKRVRNSTPPGIGFAQDSPRQPVSEYCRRDPS